MKRINLFILLVALLCSSSTIAQDSGNMLKSNNEGWKGLRFSYDRTKAKVDVDGAFDYKFNGASVGYVHAFKLAKKFHYLWNSEGQSILRSTKKQRNR